MDVVKIWKRRKGLKKKEREREKSIMQHREGHYIWYKCKEKRPKLWK